MSEREAKLTAIQGVLDLMNDAGRPKDEQRPGTIWPHSNGYGCWFIDPDGMGTYPLKAEDILERIEASSPAPERVGGR